LTPSGIEPATFRFVTQHLNHCATAVPNKLNNFFKITVILNNVFRPQKTRKKTTIKLHNTLALPVLLYGSETGLLKQGTAEE